MESTDTSHENLTRNMARHPQHIASINPFLSFSCSLAHHLVRCPRPGPGQSCLHFVSRLGLCHLCSLPHLIYQKEVDMYLILLTVADLAPLSHHRRTSLWPPIRSQLWPYPLHQQRPLDAIAVVVVANKPTRLS